MYLHTSRELSFDDVLAAEADLQKIGISIIQWFKPEPILHLWFNNSVLTAVQNEDGDLWFSIPDRGPLPCHTIGAVEELLNCSLERCCLVPPSSGCSDEQRQAVVDLVGETHLSPSAQILQYACGKPHAIERDTPLWQQAEIAKALLEQNPELREERNSNLVLSLVQDAYDRLDPPFKFTVRKRNPAAAKLCAQTLLVWAEQWEEAAKKPEPELL
jgi:hypothetical protein